MRIRDAWNKANKARAYRALAREWRGVADELAADGVIDANAISACHYYERLTRAALSA